MLSVAAVVGSSSSGGANVTTPPARKRVKAESGGTPTQPVVAAHSPPSNWPQVLQGIQQMRLPGGAAAGAAVDSMGCDRCHEETVEPPEMRFQVLPSHTSLGWGSLAVDVTLLAVAARVTCSRHWQVCWGRCVHMVWVVVFGEGRVRRPPLCELFEHATLLMVFADASRC